MKFFWRIFYYAFAQHLPDNYFPFIGKISRAARNFCCRKFCKKIDKTANIQKRVYIGNGADIEIGAHSGLGAYSRVQSCKLKMGNDVMVGEWLCIVGGGIGLKRKTFQCGFKENCQNLRLKFAMMFGLERM